MKLQKTFFSLFLILSVSVVATAQTEDVRAATGLPIPIGQPVIYGKVTIQGLDKADVKPLVFVTVLANGIQVDRVQTNDSGFYYFLRAPSEGMTIVYEIDNAEVGREVLTPGLGRTLRRDISVDWRAYKKMRATKNEIISAQSDYPGRTPAAQDALAKAMEASKAKRYEQATTLLRSVLDSDAKDYPAWTELGTVYFSSGNFAEAESSYRKAIEIKPDFTLAIMNLGKLQLSQKNFEGAVVSFTKAAQTDLNSADAFHYLGESYLQLKQGSRAVIALNEAIRLAPLEKAELHLRLAALYNSAGYKPLASAEYSKFLEKVKDHPDKKKMEQYIRENPPRQ